MKKSTIDGTVIYTKTVREFKCEQVNRMFEAALRRCQRLVTLWSSVLAFGASAFVISHQVIA